MNPQFWWYVSRASGIVAGILLVLTLIWGLLLTSKIIDKKGLPAWLTDLHRYLGGLTVIFIGVHLGALVADSYLKFSWAELFVPFVSTYRAGAVAWGIGAFWGLILVEGTSLAQRRMNRKTWRTIHFVSYPVALMTALHAAQAGTDAGNPIFRVISIFLIGLLTVLTLIRIVYIRPKRKVIVPKRAEAVPGPPSEPAPATPSGPPPYTGHFEP